MPPEMKVHPRRAGQQGFTLLEAIVALAVFAVAALPLYSLFSQSVDGLFRAATANRESEATLSALSFLSAVNPMERPTGDVEVGSFRLKWRSQELSPPLDGIGYPRGQSLFQIAWYEIRAEAFLEDRKWFDIAVRQVGFRKVRSFLPFAAPAQK